MVKVRVKAKSEPHFNDIQQRPKKLHRKEFGFDKHKGDDDKVPSEVRWINGGGSFGWKGERI